MLRQTLCRWLERKPARPVMSRAGRSLSATKTAAAGLAPLLSSSSASPGYSTGDSDLRDAAATLDVVNEVPIEPFGRPVRTSAAASGAAAARNASAQEMLSRLKHKYAFPPARDGTPHAADTQQRPPMRPARHVMSTLRRPHAASSSKAAAATPTVDEADTDDAAASVDDADVADIEGEGFDDAANVGGDDDAGDGAHPSTEEVEAHSDDGASTTATAAAATSDAYRFLLNHIDAEIAALQRRHTAVTTRRQGVQTAQTKRVKELFELIEAPWSLLPTAVQPALPATGVDVFIKEQQLARQQRTTAGGDGQDKMYVLALHKNYKSMPAGRKRFYEEAAQHNAAVREEMKYQLTRGCARFEAFLENAKECTMVMAREGQVPELPSGHTHQHQQHHNRFQRPQRPAAAVLGSGQTAMAAAEAVESVADAAPTTKTGPSRAARRIKNAAAAAKASKADHAPLKKDASHGASKTGKSSKAAARPKAKRAKSPAKLTTKASSSKKTAAAAASPPAAKAGHSRSIPLPNLNNLALKKIKQLTAQSGKKVKAGKAAKGKASAAGRGKKKK